MSQAIHTLLDDDYDDLRLGLIREFQDGAYREMHAQPEHPSDNLAGWTCQDGGWALPRELWKCVRTKEGKRIRSLATATVCDSVTLAKGDQNWRDITASVSVRLRKKGDGWGGPVGLCMRYLDSQRYYAVVIDKDGWCKILRRNGRSMDLLASALYPVKLRTEDIHIKVHVRGSRIVAIVGTVEMSATDAAYPAGKIALIGAQPADFSSVRVTCSDKELSRLQRQKKVAGTRLRKKSKKTGQPVLWKKIDLKDFGTGRRIRLGDLTGDGKLDIVLSRFDMNQPSKRRDIDCLTAINLAGDVLWQVGTPPPQPQQELSADTAFQINDVDGDGNAEVVCVRNREVQVLYGATGEMKYRRPVPTVDKLPDVYKNSLQHWGGGYGDESKQWPAVTLAFADFAGRGARRDIILLDHYHHAIALDPELNELWRWVNPHGHFPLPFDFDGDGVDSICLGYHRVSHDGKQLARICMEDHQDAIFAGSLDRGGTDPTQVLMCGGEDGLISLTPDYHMHQRVMGHVQRIAIGSFRQDIAGLSVATILFHNNRGIISLYDNTLAKIWTREFPVIGATLQPVLFDDSGVEYMLLSALRPAQGYVGGLMDGDGEIVSTFPDDGGPCLCSYACDLDGDGLDEIITWDYERMWIYHSDADVDADKILRPTRPPLYNMSNFQAYYSLAPGLSL